MNNDFLKLSDINTGDECVIVKVHGHGSFRNRIIELGFVKGEKIKVVKNAPLHDPIEYELMGTHISLRRNEARFIEVVKVLNERDNLYNGTFVDDDFQRVVKEKTNTIEVALVGNPNCGKTSFFNQATGANEKVGNYSGVTVGAKEISFKYKSYTIKMVDLPGTYSITDCSSEELYVRNYITEHHPDIVLNVVDATNIERNLYLTTQLIDMNISVLMALNMYDELQKNGDVFDYHYLGHLLGFTIVPTTASKGKGISNVLDEVIETFEGRADEIRHVHINYGQDIEKAISLLKPEIVKNKSIVDEYAPRYLAIKLLENDEFIENLLRERLDNFEKIEQMTKSEISKLEKLYKEDTKALIANFKYGFIRGALKETYKENKANKRKITNRIDSILTHSVFGFPFLILFMFLTFQATFILGEYPVMWIESLVAYISDILKDVLVPGILTDLLVDGIIAGVGGVVVFLPNILILFLFISLLEDTGYMARAAFIMDRLMHKIGLHGKSFIPMVVGFGCSVPAVMATRTLESKRDRFITMLIVPFVSCSAKLPVYLLLVSACFSANQGLMLLLIYLIGLLVAVVTSLLLKSFVFEKSSDPFVMELPPYRMPTWRNLSVHMWMRAKQYLQKMASIILLASIIIWALGYFPVVDGLASPMEQSYIGKIGKFIAPLIEPLGFDWKIGVSIISGFAAKEVIVSTLSVLSVSIVSPLVAFVLMLFILLYSPCIATLIAIYKESNFKWALFSFIYSTFVAWLICFVVYQVGLLM